MTTDQPFQSVSPGSEWQKEAEENGRRSAAPAPRMCLIIDEAEEVDKTCAKALGDPFGSMDAQKWAKEFMRIWAGRWAEVDEALMISWFANAIMSGFDEGGRRQKETDREELDALRQAIGMLATLHPTMVMDPPNPVGMALQVHAHVTQEIASLQSYIAERVLMTPAEIAEIADLKARSERDMCADGHERIRYTPEEDFGPCPLCLCWSEVAALKARDAEWEARARNWLASPEAGAQLEGYRSLGQRTADAENARDIALAEIAALKANIEEFGTCFTCKRKVSSQVMPGNCADCMAELRAERDALKAKDV